MAKYHAQTQNVSRHNDCYTQTIAMPFRALTQTIDKTSSATALLLTCSSGWCLVKEVFVQRVRLWNVFRQILL